MLSLIALAAGCGLAAAPPVVTVDRDNVEITESCVIEAGMVPDEDGNGVVHITADNLTVEFAPTPLRGAPADADPDTLAGIGIVVTGSFVTLRGAHVHGYRVGIHAREAEELVIEGCDVSDNFRQRLRSTPLREDPADWLRPHANDDNEWMHRYGAGIYVEESSRPTIHDVRARRVQNGIILDTVWNAKVYDNDCSFLSGWGLALWRCTYCSIVQNAFDFCVRGYSHGVYNRGQDSAGILMFEQCAGNLVAYNSATHCGDGFFGFSGREALGEVRPRDDLEWYRQKGNVDNSLLANDFSYAAAHGIEMTFGFRNRFLANRLVGNAICGIWAGYSQLSQCEMNTIYDNGRMGYGLERGGINIEHSFKNRIRANNFQNNACGIHLSGLQRAAQAFNPRMRVRALTLPPRHITMGNPGRNKPPIPCQWEVSMVN